MTRHGSMNSRNRVHPSVGSETGEQPMHHCGRCKNPFLSNPHCECPCHHDPDDNFLLGGLHEGDTNR